ncbi:hypothetical protein V1511DRAFT_504833 [Dipodascopsis uninucleata]
MATVTAPRVTFAPGKVEPFTFYDVDVKSTAAKPLTSDEVQTIINTWLTSFNWALKHGSATDVANVFLERGFWRDMLSLSWDFHTLEGRENIASFVGQHLSDSGLSNFELDSNRYVPRIVSMDEGYEMIQAFLTFETKVGKGTAVVRLVKDIHDERKPKAFNLYTCLDSLNGSEERLGSRRGQGVEHGQHEGRKSWKEKRALEQEFVDDEPTVVIVGGGQAGLTIAARLKMLGIKSLIIERNERVGDNWRKRYKFLVLHDPVYYDHLPYMKFPDFWPVFTPKDKLAEFFEFYASSLELNIWLESSLDASSYNDDTGEWTLNVTRKDGSMRVLHPRHVVQCTGHSGEPNIPHFEGENIFKGQIVHSSKHTTGANFAGMKAVVVGCCNSGHDIAQDFYEQGADVTMLQRSSTYVMSSENGLGEAFKGLYDETGPSVDLADHIFFSTPTKVYGITHQSLTKRIAELDSDILDGLTKAGFKLDYGYNGTGFLLKYYRRGGGYYLDVGCSKLIGDGKVKIKQGTNIKRFTEDSIEFEDGSSLKADIVVLATGYKNMRETGRKIFGDKVADRCRDVWGLDDEGELRTMWRDSGHPGFWFHGGNLSHCRFYSKLLALQILAEEKGLKPRRNAEDNQ